MLQQQSTGEEIYRQKSSYSITRWEKLVVKKALRSVQKQRFWQALKDHDYVASWYGPDYDNFMRVTPSRETRDKVCAHAFKEYVEDRLTQDEMFDILRRTAEMFKNKPLKVKKNKRKYYEQTGRTSRTLSAGGN